MKVVDGWLKQLHEEVGSDLFVTVDAPPCIAPPRKPSSQHLQPGQGLASQIFQALHIPGFLPTGLLWWFGPLECRQGR